MVLYDGGTPLKNANSPTNGQIIHYTNKTFLISFSVNFSLPVWVAEFTYCITELAI